MAKKQLTREDVLAILEKNTLPKIKRCISPSGLEVMDIINAHELSYSGGNILKYVIRSGATKDFDGLSKAYWYTLRELQYHAKDPLAKFTSTRTYGPSVKRIAEAFKLNATQRNIVKELLRKTPDAHKRICGLLKVAAMVKELIDHANPDIETESRSGAKVRPGKKKFGKKRS